MSTRALYTFIGSTAADTWNVYKHSDGYPSGATTTITDAFKWFAWKPPRYEPDELAAAFCAAGKAYRMIRVAEGRLKLKQFREEDERYRFCHGGGVRFMPQGEPMAVACKNCGDIEYRYEISAGNDSMVRVRAFSVRCRDTPKTSIQELLFDCALSELANTVADWEKARDNAENVA